MVDFNRIDKTVPSKDIGLKNLELQIEEKLKLEIAIGDKLYHIHHLIHSLILIAIGIALVKRYKALGWTLIIIGSLLGLHKIYRDRPKDIEGFKAMFITAIAIPVIPP